MGEPSSVAAEFLLQSVTRRRQKRSSLRHSNRPTEKYPCQLFRFNFEMARCAIRLQLGRQIPALLLSSHSRSRPFC